MLPFIDHGTGDVVVFLHAFPFDARMWTPQARGVSTIKRFIAPHLRGFGLAKDRETPRSIVEHADDVAALLDHLNVATATIVGLSMGGYVALAFADKYPTRMDALVLANTRAAADTGEAKANRDRNIELVKRRGVKALVDAALPNMLADATSDLAKTKIREIAEDQAAEGVIAALEAMRDRPDRTAELPAIEVPTVLIAGAEDTIVAEAEMDAMGRLIPNARLVNIVGAKHLSNVDASGPFGLALSLVGASYQDQSTLPPGFASALKTGRSG